MRVTIEPLGAAWLKPLVLVDATPLNGWRDRGEYLMLAPKPSGLDGWLEPADPRTPDRMELPRSDGSFWPEETFLSSRILTIRGFHFSGDGSSSLAESAFRDNLSALVGPAVRVTVADSAGPREVVGFVGSQPVITYKSEAYTQFSVIVSCPDPLKYGDRVSQDVAAGSRLVAVENTGTGFVPFVVSTANRVSRVYLELDGQRVEWIGNSLGLVLDLADGVPRNSAGVETGTLIWADLIRVPPGVHQVRVESDVAVSVTVRPGWK